MAKAQDTEVKNDATDEDNDPIYYSPKSLSLVSVIAAWGSWVVLAGFILVIAAQLQYLMGIASDNGTTMTAMLADPQQGAQVRSFIYNNLALPLLTGAALFLLLQAASIGLNVLLEIDFNIREPRN